MILERERYGFLSRMRRKEGIAPFVPRNEEKQLGLNRKTLFEASLASSMGFIILLFLFFPTITPKQAVQFRPQETVTIEEIERTKQEFRAPPPPRPAIPIEAPGDEVLEDVDIASTELDVQQEVAAPPPPETKESDDVFFVAVEEVPEIIGGTEAIARALVYPDIALRAQVQGRVFVLAYVNEFGDVVRAEVLKGIGAGCDEAAVAAVKQVKFIPGKQRGKAVKVKISIPVVFRIRSS